MELNQLADNKGARKRKMIVGRGIGSGKGKTCGRGYKGQKSRTGVSIHGFEGGQMPLHRRLPKRGFTNVNRKDYAVINLADLQRAIDAKLLDGGNVTTDSLAQAGLIKASTADRIKLLGNGALTSKVTITVARASKTAIEAVEKAGGSVTVTVEPKKMPEADTAQA